jgi:tetratricopeptide (TPR) repeat protein/CHAT domain-containing protein
VFASVVTAILLPAFSRPASTQAPASTQPPAASVQVASAEAASIFGDVLTRFYEAYARKDLPAMEALWHPKGPARHGRNIAELEFELKTASLVNLVVTEASITPGGGRARAIVDLSVVDAKTKRTRRERRVRETTFLQDAGAWKIWNDSASGLGMQIADRLLAASPEARASLIATDREVRSDDALLGLGLQVNRLRSQGKLREVVDALSVRASLARALGNEAVLAASLLDTGLVYQVLGRQDEAGRAFTEARELYVRVGTKGEVAIVDANLGSVEYVLGNYSVAADRFRQALEVFESEKTAPRLASALHGLGNALYMQGDFEPAMDAYQRCLSLHEASSDKYSASRVLQAMALVHKEVDSYAAAAEAYSRSAELSRAIADHGGAARAEHGLGEAYRLLGDHARALQHFTAGLALWEKTQDAANRAGTLYAIGQVYALQRSLPRAVEFYQRALEIDTQIGERPGLARDLGGLGGAHFGQGQLPLALEEFQKSLAIREQLKDVPGTMWTVVHIGVLQTALAQHSEALQSYQRALSIAEPAGDGGAVCTILALRAANELVRDDIEAALASAGKASEMAQRLEMFDALANAKVTAGKAHRKAGRLPDAVASLQEAVDALERVPVGPGVETFFDDRRSPYLTLVDLLATESGAPAPAAQGAAGNTSRLAAAFRYWERARTRNLATLLGGDGAAVVKDLTAAERDRERLMARNARVLAVRLKRERGRTKPDPERIDALAKELGRALDERTAYRRTLFEAHPALPVLRAQNDPAEIEAAGRVLAPGEALLSFVVLEQKAHVFVVGDAGAAGQARRAAVVRTIEVKATDLAAKVAAFREAIARRDAAVADTSRELYDLLIAPVRADLGRAKSVVVLPDAFLWGLPFEALVDDRGRYLVQDLAVSYAPSLTALAAMRASAGQAGRRPALLATADPAVAAPALERLSLLRPATAPPFPAAARELRGLSLVFGSRAAQLLAKDQARIDRLASFQAGSALHLGVPGCLLDASPLYSLLALSPAGPDDTDQGLVEVADTMGWTLPAGVVSFSRLEAGPGGASGDALAALAWSLHIAGADSLVVNRWLPPESGSPALAGFYRAWISRSAPRLPATTAAAAMQRAARALLAQPGAHPADWAGFMVIGR